MKDPTDVAIYVRLLDEGVDVWRPMRATPLGSGLYRLAASVMPETETWEFMPGAVVVGELRLLSEREEPEPVLVAFGTPDARVTLGNAD